MCYSNNQAKVNTQWRTHWNVHKHTHTLTRIHTQTHTYVLKAHDATFSNTTHADILIFFALLPSNWYAICILVSDYRFLHVFKKAYSVMKTLLDKFVMLTFFLPKLNICLDITQNIKLKSKRAWYWNYFYK